MKKFVENIDELTYSYFSQDTPYFQTLFTAKKEFARLALPKELEPVPPRGKFYSNQILDRIFLDIWDFLFLDNEPGTGKTAVCYAITENFRKNFGLSPEVAASRGVCNFIKDIWIIVPGGTVERSWKSLFQKHSLLDIMPSNYHIVHRGTFYNQYSNIPIDQLKIIFANSLFIIDEVQELLTRSKEDKPHYEWFKMIFRVIPNIKIILATGTPIVMKSNELGFTMNLFPGTDMPIDDDWYKEATDDDLEPYLRGRVSYLRNRLHKAAIVWPENAVKVDKHSDIRVVWTTMSKFQTDEYRKVYDSRDPFHKPSLMRSLCAVPENQIQYNRLSDDKYLKQIAIKQYALKHYLPTRQGIKFIVCSFIGEGIDVTVQVLKSLGYEEFAPSGRKTVLDLEKLGKKKRFGVIRAQKDAVNAKIIELERKRENLDGEYLEIVLTSDVGSLSISLHNVQTYIVMDPTRNEQSEKQREARIFRPDAYDDLYNRNTARGMSDEDAVIKVESCRFVAEPDDPDLDSIDFQTYRRNILKDIGPDSTRIAERRIAFDAQVLFARNQENCPEEQLKRESAGRRERRGAKGAGGAEGMGSARKEKDAKGESKGAKSKGKGKEKAKSKEKNQVEGEIDNVCFYGFYDPEPEQEDLSTYQLLHGQEEAEPIIRELINVLTSQFSIDMDDFWNRKKRDTNILVFYRRMRDLLSSGGQVVTNFGQTAYLRNIGNTIYIATEEDLPYEETDIAGLTEEEAESNGTNLKKVISYPDTAIYTNMHTSMKTMLNAKRKSRKAQFETIEQLEEFLNNLNVELPRKIDAIEGILIQAIEEVGAIGNLKSYDDPIYNYIMERYGDRYIFIMKKPTRRIAFLSQISDPEVRSKVPIGKIKNVTSNEDVLVHILYCQYNISKNTRYSIYPSHVSAGTISIFNNQTIKFDILEFKSAEQVVYADIIVSQIKPRWLRFLDKSVEKNGERGRIVGMLYDPDLVFRIYDNRKAVVYTQKGLENKATKSRGQNCLSYGFERLVDFAVYLGLSSPDYEVTKKDLKKSAEYWINQGNRINNIKKIVKDRYDYYSNPKNKERLIMFIKWASSHQGTSTSGSQKKTGRGSKQPVCEMIEEYLNEHEQVYTF